MTHQSVVIAHRIMARAEERLALSRKVWIMAMDHDPENIQHLQRVEDEYFRDLKMYKEAVSFVNEQENAT